MEIKTEIQQCLQAFAGADLRTATFFEQANATDHPIRNRLARIISDSPELLAVIKKEGKV